MRILIIKGASQYGGTRLFAESAGAALCRAGHAVEVLDLVGSADARALLAAHAPGCETDAVFTIGILGEYRDAQGRSLSEAYRAPHILWLVDYMLGQMTQLLATPSQTTLLSIDPTQLDSIRAALGPDHFPGMDFFPHPGVGDPAPDEATASEFASNRPVALLWSGSFVKPDTTWSNLAPQLRAPLKDAIDLALSVEWMPPHEALAQALARRGIDVADPTQRGVLRLAVLVDDVVRKTRRFEFLKAVAKTGIPIRICGVGWEPNLYRFKNATYEGAVDMTRMVELMRQSRVVLNTNVNFGAGSHERPFSAALAGAAPFSDHSRYYDEAFAPGEIELFRWQDLGGAMDRLRDLAADPGRCFEMGRAAKARAVAEHTWDRRIDSLLGHLSKPRFSQSA